MSTEFIRETVAAYFKANFTAADVEYENFDTIEISTRTTPFLDMSFRFTDNDPISLGDNSLTRQYGAVQADIYVKAGTGTKAAHVIAGAVDTLLGRKSISGIEFQTTKTLTPITQAGWYRLTVRCPFYMDS